MAAIHIETWNVNKQYITEDIMAVINAPYPVIKCYQEVSVETINNLRKHHELNLRFENLKIYDKDIPECTFTGEGICGNLQLGIASVNTSILDKKGKERQINANEINTYIGWYKGKGDYLKDTAAYAEAVARGELNMQRIVAALAVASDNRKKFIMTPETYNIVCWSKNIKYNAHRQCEYIIRSQTKDEFFRFKTGHQGVITPEMLSFKFEKSDMTNYETTIYDHSLGVRTSPIVNFEYNKQIYSVISVHGNIPKDITDMKPLELLHNIISDLHHNKYILMGDLNLSHNNIEQYFTGGIRTIYGETLSNFIQLIISKNDERNITNIDHKNIKGTDDEIANKAEEQKLKMLYETNKWFFAETLDYILSNVPEFNKINISNGAELIDPKWDDVYPSHLPPGRTKDNIDRHDLHDHYPIKMILHAPETHQQLVNEAVIDAHADLLQTYIRHSQ